MKKHISLILTGLLIAVMVNAQTPETLTNSSVIKMSKANLSDELITDMIQNSPVKFDLSESALKKLAGEGVSCIRRKSNSCLGIKGTGCHSTRNCIYPFSGKKDCVCRSPQLCGTSD
jgi:hypothetical protein